MKLITSQTIIIESYQLSTPPALSSSEDEKITLVRFPTIVVDYQKVRTADDYRAMLYEGYGRSDLDPDITAARFPLGGSNVVDIEPALLSFDSEKKTEEIVQALDECSEEGDWRAGNIGALCCFGATYPDQYREKSIVGFGSVGWVSGHSCVPVLGEGGCGVGHRQLENVWDKRFCFFLMRRPHLLA